MIDFIQVEEEQVMSNLSPFHRLLGTKVKTKIECRIHSRPLTQIQTQYIAQIQELKSLDFHKSNFNLQINLGIIKLIKGSQV